MKKVTMQQVRKRYRTMHSHLASRVERDREGNVIRTYYERVWSPNAPGLRSMVRETPRSFFVGELSPKLAHIHSGPHQR